MPGGPSKLDFPDHFDGERFYNPGAPQARGLLDVLRWKLTSRPERSPGFIPDVEESIPPRRVGTRSVDGRNVDARSVDAPSVDASSVDARDVDADSVNDATLRITLVNHSTVLMQQRGVNILTDPIWSERASPVRWAGPRRRRKPGVAWENLPPIDAVLVSHNHYDHLDLETLRRLAARSLTRFVAPLGVGRLLRSEDIGPVDEMDWGDALPFPDRENAAGFTVHSVPALHFSSRHIFDWNRTLWCGYVIECAGRLVYFAADTAFGRHFADIREKFGPPHVALLPIGAYQPRWFMAAVHMGPDDAVRAHEILGAKISIAIHHGTFQLADDGIDTPRRELAACAPRDSFLVLNNGEFFEIASR